MVEGTDVSNNGQSGKTHLQLWAPVLFVWVELVPDVQQ